MYKIKLSNNSEQKVLDIVVEKYPNITILKGKDVPDVKWVKKNLKNQTVLIINAKNPELPKTDLGNFRTIEFCLIKNNIVYWIDVQYLSKPSSIHSILYGKIISTVNCKDVYLFPVDGLGYTDSNLKGYEYQIKKVKSKAHVFKLKKLSNRI
ncbi:MAG: hypothetical protein ACOC22_00830 [bacterium]